MLLDLGQAGELPGSLHRGILKFTKAKSLRVDAHYIEYKLAKLNFKQRRFDVALDYIEACMAKESKYFKAMCLKGIIELEKPDGKFELAKNYFMSTLQSDSLTKDKEKKAYIGLSRCKENEGNFNEALAYIRKALNINPYDNNVREKLALLYVKTRELRKAINQYKMILKDKEEKKNSRLFLEIGTLFVFLGQYNNGHRYLE